MTHKMLQDNTALAFFSSLEPRFLFLAGEFLAGLLVMVLMTDKNGATYTIRQCKLGPTLYNGDNRLIYVVW